MRGFLRIAKLLFGFVVICAAFALLALVFGLFLLGVGRTVAWLR